MDATIQKGTDIVSQKDDGRSAFPYQAIASGDELTGDLPGDPGMTLRQWYAGQAVVGLMANANGRYENNAWASNVASDAVTLADALIAELDKEDE